MTPLTPDQKRARLEALTKLAIATREKVERETFAVYLESLSGWSTAILVEACRRLQTASQWFPKVAEIVESCRVVEREKQIREDQKKLKPAEFVPVPREIVEDFMRQIREATGRHDLNRAIRIRGTGDGR